MEKIVDSWLVRVMRDQFTEVKKMWQVAIGELIELGILCTEESPSTRPTMLWIVSHALVLNEGPMKVKDEVQIRCEIA
ncbi:hypothetical protein LguiA_028474 [Lonicera macranthoides]